MPTEDNRIHSNDGEVKLGDLGLAKSSDQQQGLAMTGAMMGAPLYVSPEQAEGRRDIDLRTVIYSLGANWYYVLAGVAPYSAKSAIFMMMTDVGHRCRISARWIPVFRQRFRLF